MSRLPSIARRPIAARRHFGNYLGKIHLTLRIPLG
jgi:hypothetical protein